MNIQAEKVDIIEQVIKIQDERLLQAIRNLIEFGLQYQEQGEESDFWEDLTEAQRSRIKESMYQLDTGKSSTHENVMTEFRQRYHS